VALLLNVRRHPYSFLGDSRKQGSLAGFSTPEGKEPTWHESLLDYCRGSESARTHAEETMRDLGRCAGIELDYNVQTNWQPVDSQRVMLWARQFGKQETYMAALARRHFEMRKSASHRTTILEAAKEAGLDEAAAKALLETDELTKAMEVVWLNHPRKRDPCNPSFHLQLSAY